MVQSPLKRLPQARLRPVEAHPDIGGRQPELLCDLTIAKLVKVAQLDDDPLISSQTLQSGPQKPTEFLDGHFLFGSQRSRILLAIQGAVRIVLIADEAFARRLETTKALPDKTGDDRAEIGAQRRLPLPSAKDTEVTMPKMNVDFVGEVIEHRSRRPRRGIDDGAYEQIVALNEAPWCAPRSSQDFSDQGCVAIGRLKEARYRTLSGKENLKRLLRSNVGRKDN